jgi:methylmalonyl-CoA mutase C-terminal domain/subunit
MDRPIRILMAKVGLDGHDRGVKVVAQALRDSGMEVIYTGLHNTPQQAVRAALQEDVDVVGVSILSGAHMTLLPKMRKLMDDEGLTDVLLMAGGTIPEEDKDELRQQNIGGLFGPGTFTENIIQYINDEVTKLRGAQAA